MGALLINSLPLKKSTFRLVETANEGNKDPFAN